MDAKNEQIKNYKKMVPMFKQAAAETADGELKTTLEIIATHLDRAIYAYYAGNEHRYKMNVAIAYDFINKARGAVN